MGSKRDLLRLSKRDLLRLSKRDLLRLSKRAEEDSNRDLRLSKRPEWSEVDWQPPPPRQERQVRGADDNPPLEARPEPAAERGLVGRSRKGIAPLQASI